MPEPDDITLIKQFAEGDESAFTALFYRHVNLVYSVALRQVRNPSHAEEITQAVFILLARKSKSLSPKTVLSGWLYQAARLTSASLIRREVRRQRREQEAYMQSLNPPEPPVWEQIAPLLEDAMGCLGEQDRNAVVLSYFENRSSQEVAATLKLNEATARKRVSRAVEKMRRFFLRRGIVISAGAIAAAVSTHSVQAVPAGRAAIIAANVISGTTTSTAAVVAATKAIAMTTLQKSIITAALVVTVGAGIFEAHQNFISQKQIENLRQQQDSLNDQLAQLQRERDDATNVLGGLIAENAKLKSNANEHELLKLRGEMAASRAAADAAAKAQSLGNNSEQAQVDYQRAKLDQFFKMANLSPEKADRYVHLEVEMNRRQNDRIAALLNGTLSVADAARQRDLDSQQQQDQRRELLGPDGWDVLQSIADGMRNDTAKRLTGTVQANMGDNPLTQEQSDRLQTLIKAEVAANSMDDVDMFRSVDEWTQMVADREQHVLQAASAFLTPAQLGTLQSLEGQQLKLLLQQRDQRRNALGISQ